MADPLALGDGRQGTGTGSIAKGSRIQAANARTTERNVLEELKNILKKEALLGDIKLSEKIKFEKLKELCDEQNVYPAIEVQKFTRLESHEKEIEFRRLTSVYSRQMFNMFIMPVWAAAIGIDGKTHVGYVLYPKMTPVKERLQAVVCKDEETQKHALRLCFAPIALAIEALHSHVPNKRTMYYHRDIHIGNVFLPSAQDDNGDTVYGEAKLRMSRISRGSQHECMDMSQSTFIEQKYYHHPDPWCSEKHLYHRKHDWFSFAVYMLEALGIVLGLKVLDANLDLSESAKKSSYESYAKELQGRVDNRTWTEKAVTAPLLSQYLDIAKRCLSIDQADINNILMEYEVPDECRNRFPKAKSEDLYFEYGLHEWTAQLLWMYEGPSLSQHTYESYYQLRHDDEVSEDEENEEDVKDRKEICEACLLHTSIKIPTRTYRRGAERRRKLGENDDVDCRNPGSKCDDDCDRAYCGLCYSNGERLFCLRLHGTTSTVIGGNSSYALILYGSGYKADEKKDVFEKDARYLANVLKHKLICGIPEQNVVLEKLFCDTPNWNADKCLDDVCTRMRKLIHNRRWTGDRFEDSGVCRSERDYSLFIFYSGHGLGSGSWSPKGPNSKDAIRYVTVNEHLKSLRDCTNTHNPSCQGSCAAVTYIMDHCYTDDHQFDVAKSAKNDVRDSTCTVETEARRNLDNSKDNVQSAAIQENVDVEENAAIVESMAVEESTTVKGCTTVEESMDVEESEHGADGKDMESEDTGVCEAAMENEDITDREDIAICCTEAPMATTIATQPFTESYSEEGRFSEITEWFCWLLRCLFDEPPPVELRGKMRRRRFQKHVKTLKDDIAGRCHNAFIDGKALDYHKNLMCKDFGYKTSVKVDAHPRYILAYYHPQGIHYQIFPYEEEEGERMARVDFDLNITCGRIKEAISRTKCTDGQSICLLENLDNDYSKYNFPCDDKVRNTLESSLLYYVVIKRRTKVYLKVTAEHTEPLSDELDGVEIADLAELIVEYQDKDKPADLPNILAHIVHHLRYSNEYQNGDVINMYNTLLDMFMIDICRGAISESGSSAGNGATFGPGDRATSGLGGSAGDVDKKMVQVAGTDSQLTTAERVRKSFARLVFKTPPLDNFPPMEKFNSQEWQTLQDDACWYLRSERRDFTMKALIDGVSCSVEWSDSELWSD